MKKTKFKSYPTYNKINKSNKEVVEVSQDELDNLPESEKKEYKYLMTRNKEKVVTPPGPTDHELLLLILDKLTILENRVNKIVKLNNLKE